MISLRFLLLVTAICLASGVKAQSQLRDSEVLFFHYCENTSGLYKTPPLSDPEAQILCLNLNNS